MPLQWKEVEHGGRCSFIAQNDPEIGEALRDAPDIGEAGGLIHFNRHVQKQRGALQQKAPADDGKGRAARPRMKALPVSPEHGKREEAEQVDRSLRVAIAPG